MGFSLVGNSGDQTTNTTNNNLSASINPQLDFQDAGEGVLGVNISPVALQGSTGGINSSITDYYAPVDISSVGTAQGDSALAAIANIAQAQAATETPVQLAQAANTSASTFSLSSLLSGDTLYWVLGAVVLFFIAHRHP